MMRCSETVDFVIGTPQVVPSSFTHSQVCSIVSVGETDWTGNEYVRRGW